MEVVGHDHEIGQFVALAVELWCDAPRRKLTTRSVVPQSVASIKMPMPAVREGSSELGPQLVR